MLEDYKKASNTVDVAIVRSRHGVLEVLLVKRGSAPYKDKWAIPGGFLRVEDQVTLEEAARKVLEEKTGATGIPVKQLGTYGDPKRDKRGRVISTVYYAFVNFETLGSLAVDSVNRGSEIGWFPVKDPGVPLAFDHKKILKDLLADAKDRLGRYPIVFQLLDSVFTWKDVETVYQSVAGKPLVNMRRFIGNRYVVEKTGEQKIPDGKACRPAALLRYVREVKA